MKMKSSRGDLSMARIPPELTSLGTRPEEPTDPITRLRQDDTIRDIDQLGTGEWTTLYEVDNPENAWGARYSGLVTAARTIKALETDSWDVTIGDGRPGFTQYNENGNPVNRYERFGFYEIELLVYVRYFHDIKQKQIDISEEFRLYHNLYHDRANDRYLYIDGRGNESVAVEVTRNRVRAKTRLLRQYMAARQLALALYFDIRAEASVETNVVTAALSSIDVIKDDRRYAFRVGDSSDGAFSRVVGKKIIPPPPVTKSGVWPFEEGNDKFADFIIGVSADGQPVEHNCNPDRLANYFGANEEAPHYLTPVWFSRSVLSKYYDDPSKYSVEDGYLRCGSLWGMQIDNNVRDYVVVYLGDLGRDLDFDEQVFWRHHNVTPGDRKPSETNFRRSFLAQFTNPSEPDLVFRQRYIRLNERWEKRFGWPLFRPLHEDDAHIIKQFRTPITDASGEFDTQVLYLVKLLVDSLNEKELAQSLGGTLPDEKGIGKFERFLQADGYALKERDIKLLRTLQRLRSKGAAHIKGSEFDELRKSLGLGEEGGREVFRRLLGEVNTMLGDLSAHFVEAG
jgi:hypothetical protein